MFSSNEPKVSLEVRIVEITKELSETLVYLYVKRNDLKEEKKNLLAKIKEKEKVSKTYSRKYVFLEINKNQTFYQPTELYKGYPNHHEDRQKLRKDNES